MGALAADRLCKSQAEGERGMSNRRKTGKLAPFIAMDRNQYKSAAFAQLSAVAQAMLVHLTYNYNSIRMNDVWMAAREGAIKLNVSKTCAAKALHELEHYGFIVEVRGAYLGVNGKGQSAHYRLTAQRYGEVGATRDYEKWNGEIFSPKKRGKPERKTRTKPWIAEGVSRATWYRRQAVRQNPVRQEGQCVRPEGHSSLIQNPPEK
jgi:DNA-binding transcriptional regulator YhcF (GntR family)